MKKTIVLFISLVFILANVNAQKLSKLVPKIIVIGIGEKNLSFDESQFPDLDVFYTPTLIVNNFGTSLEERTTAGLKEGVKAAHIPFYGVGKKGTDVEKYSGTPEFIIDADSRRPMTNTYMLFDKDGLCYTIGYDARLNSKTQNANKKTFGDNLTAVVKKSKTVKPAKKPYTIGKGHSIIGNKLGAFPVQSIDGETFELNSMLGKEPVLILFFYLDPELDAKIQILSDEEAKGLTFWEITLHEEYRDQVYDATAVLRAAEKQFFEMKFKKYKK